MAISATPAAFPRRGFFGLLFEVKPVLEWDFSSVFNQEFRVEIVSVEHANITIKLVKTALVEIAQRRRIVDAPFSKATGFVASLPQKSSHDEVLRSQQAGTVAANTGMAGMQSGY